MLARLWIAVVALIAANNLAASAEVFRPRFDQAALEMGKHTFRPIRVASPWYPEIWIGGLWYRVEGDTVIQSEGETRKIVKQARSPDGATLRWKGALRNVALLVEHVSGGIDLGKKAPDAVVRRLNLQTMQWLPSLASAPQPPAASQVVKAREGAAVKAWEEQRNKYRQAQKSAPMAVKPERGTGVCDLIVVEQGTMILSYLDLGVQGLMGRATLGFQIALIPAEAEKPAWSHWIDYPENPQERSPFSGSPSIVFSSSHPAVEPLTRTTTGVVVCLPFTHDLLCFNEKGEEEWRLSRIWEFERWNTGPSSGVWGMDRFGLEVQDNVTAVAREEIDPKVAEAERKAAQAEIDKEFREQKAAQAARGERFYKDYKAWIVAGPVRVPPLDDRRGEERLLFAIAKTRFPYNLVTVPECVIYQVHPDGGFIEGMTTLPRMVYPRPHLGIRGGSVWSCEG